MKRRRAIWLAALLVASSMAACTATSAAAPAWRVDLHDGFDGSALDAGRWTTCYWWAGDGCTISSNHEAEWYRPSQVSVHDGVLDLEAVRASSSHAGRRYTHASGMVSSGRQGEHGPVRYAFTYGKVEVRFRAPAGRGLWPAIWMLPTTNRSLPEIDLLEQVGDDTSAASMTLHPTGSDGHPDRVERREVLSADLASGWHTVGLEWSEGLLVWTLDGQEQHRVTGDAVPSEPMYLVVDLAVGGQAGTPPASTRFPAHLLVDEVTVWKRR